MRTRQRRTKWRHPRAAAAKRMPAAEEVVVEAVMTMAAAVEAAEATAVDAAQQVLKEAAISVIVSGQRRR